MTTISTALSPENTIGVTAPDVLARVLDRHLIRIDAIDQAILALMDRQLSEDARERAQSEAHALATSASSFELRNGTRIARALEQSFGSKHTSIGR